jgi:hypothetical protein
MYVMLLISKRHLVNAHIVSNRSLGHFGNMFFHHVDNYIWSVQMPGGRHSVRYATGETVD